MYENQYLSTVLAPQGFAFCVRLYSANPQGLPIVLLVPAPQSVLPLCTSVRCKSHRPLCGASLRRLCASVCCTSSKSFVRCKPTKALYSVRQGLCFCVLYEPQELCTVRAYRGFVLMCTVRAPRALRGASLQRLCASVCCTSPRSFGASLQRLYTVCARLVLLCTVRASRALCGASLQRLYTVCWCSPLKLCTECLCARAVV